MVIAQCERRGLNRYHGGAMRHSTALLALVLLPLAACQEAVTAPLATPAGPRRIVLDGVPGDLSISLTTSGALVSGNLTNIELRVSNTGTNSYSDTVFAEVLIPAGFKRQVDLVTGAIRIQCEAYRGTHGGLSQSVYSDACRIWFAGGVAPGETRLEVVPVKLLFAGDYTPWSFSMVKQFGTYVSLDTQSWLMHVLASGGGGGGGTTSALPDLQMTGKTSTASPAAGASFTATFTARNTGKGLATGVTFTAEFPLAITNLSVIMPGATCTVDSNIATCTGLASVAAGSSVTATLTANAPLATGNYGINGSIGASNGDANLSNNTPSVGFSVR